MKKKQHYLLNDIGPFFLSTSHGFTLIEIIGVLAILAVMASVLVPNVAQEIKRAVANAEDRDLESISNALIIYTRERHRIPGTASGDWDTAAAGYLSVPVGKISLNRGGTPRRMVSRPTNDLGGLPYDQSSRFTTGASPAGSLPVSAPSQVRIFFISNLNGAPPAANLNNAQFDNVWNQNGPIPNDFTESENTRICRLNLVPEFFPVAVNCINSIMGAPRWSLDNAAPKSFNGTGTFTVYLYKGTRINLYTNTVLQGTIIVNGAYNLTYDGSTSLWSY